MFFRSFSVKVDFAESSFLRRLNVHPAKSSDPKMNEHSVKKHAKNVLEKVLRKTWKTMKNGAKRGAKMDEKSIKNEVRKMIEKMIENPPARSGSQLPAAIYPLRA